MKSPRTVLGVLGATAMAGALLLPAVQSQAPASDFTPAQSQGATAATTVAMMKLPLDPWCKDYYNHGFPPYYCPDPWGGYWGGYQTTNDGSLTAAMRQEPQIPTLPPPYNPFPWPAPEGQQLATV